MRSAQGGSIVQRRRNARRARGPSSSPAIASTPAEFRRSLIESRLSTIVRPTPLGLTVGMTRTARVQPRDTPANPITGERSTVTGTAATANGELVVVEL